MKEKYLASVKKQLLSSDTQKKALFFNLLDHYSIKELKSIPSFKELKESILKLKISPQEVFEKAALQAVQKKKFETLKFLIDEKECHYDLKNTYDTNKLNLLHEACFQFDGDLKFIEYLLEKGFDPNAQDDEGETPLHRLNPELDQSKHIALLKLKGAKLDIKNKIGLTPLYKATLMNDLKTANELIKLKANTKLRWGNFSSYTDFKIAFLKGQISLDQQPIDASLTEKEDIEKKGRLQYYKACLLPNLSIKNFQEAKKLLLQGTRELNKEDLFSLINILILTSKEPFQTQNLINEVLKLIQEGKATLDNLIRCLMHASTICSSQEIAIELNDFVFNKLQSYEGSDKFLMEFYHALAFSYKNRGLFLKSEVCQQKAIDFCPQQTPDDLKMELFFNLACTQSSLLKKTESLENFRKAFLYDQNDEEAFDRYARALLENNQFDQLLTLCQESKFKEIANIYICYAATLLNKSSWNDLLKEVDKKFSNRRAGLIADGIKVDCLLELQQVDQAILLAIESLKTVEEDYKNNQYCEISIHMFRVLYVCFETNNYKLGMEFLERFTRDYPLEFNCSVLCLSTAAAICLENQQIDKAESLIKKIPSLGIKPEALVHFYLILAVEDLSHKNKNGYATAIKYIDLALKLDPNNFKGQLYKYLLSSLIEDQQSLKENLNNINLELEIDSSIVTDLRKDTTAQIPMDQHESQEENNDSILEQTEFDPIKIHQFFLKEKARLLKETCSIISNSPQSLTRWNLGSVCYEENKDGMIRINHPRFSDCYALIPSSLNFPYHNQFIKALNKCRYQQTDPSEKSKKLPRKRESGIQTLNNSVIQLKIKANNRLWTNTIYRVGNKHLIVFDHHDYHDKVREMAKKPNKLNIIELAAENKTSSLSNNPHRFLASPSISRKKENEQGHISSLNS